MPDLVLGIFGGFITPVCSYVLVGGCTELLYFGFFALHSVVLLRVLPAELP